MIGLHGPRGDGKTTFLGFVAADLEREQGVESVWYIPWRYVDKVTMLKGFFRTLASKADVKLRSDFEQLAA